MFATHPITSRLARLLRGPMTLAVILLATELLDELIYGVESAALPLIRDGLGLRYSQVGLLLTVPGVVSNALDPIIGVLGDAWKRKVLIVGGALATAAAMALVATGHTFAALLIGFSLSSPASTAYVSLSQATLMDLHPGRHEQMMARWAVLGSIGQFAGPASVAAALSLGMGWRGLYFGLAAFAAALGLALWRQRFDGAPRPGGAGRPLDGLRELPRAVRASGLVRWLILLEIADLMLDVFYNFCALYFADVVGASPAMAGAAVAVLTVGGVIGDALLIPLLDRFDGLRLIRGAAAIVLGLYASFLIVPGLWPKLALLALIGPLRSGWYQVLQGRAYAALPGRSGAVVALGSLAGLAAAVFPVLLGATAERFGLQWAMALLALGPIGLLAGLPQKRIDN